MNKWELQLKQDFMEKYLDSIVNSENGFDLGAISDWWISRRQAELIALKKECEAVRGINNRVLKAKFLDLSNSKRIRRSNYNEALDDVLIILDDLIK